MQSDSILLEQLKRGDDLAFKQLFEQYYSLMCSVAYEYVDDYFVSRTVAEDVILNIWNKKESLEIKSSLKQYLLTSTRYKSIDYLRQNSKNKNFVDIDEVINSNDRCFLSDDDLFERIITEELDLKIKNIINNMPEECRTVFVLSRYEGLRNNEIAEKLNISINTVKYHIKNSLNRLRIELQEYIAILFVIFINTF